jgi:hypothetical protein
MKIQLHHLTSFRWRKSAIFALFVAVSLLFFHGNINAGSREKTVFFDIGFGLSYAKATCEVGLDCIFDDDVQNAVAHPVDTTLSGLSSVFETLLNAVLSVLAWFANLAVSILVFVLNPQVFSALMNNDNALYQIWQWVRDMFNMFFILVLLFSAFATIFQIDKYHYKKILLNLVLMALLVNFSWPISRFIIDFFNSMMYFFLNNLFRTDATTVANNILKVSELKEIFLGAHVGSGGESATIGQLLVAIIAMFIFAMTILVLSLLMLARLVALPILVMFSPIGFAGSIMPFTAGFAKKWWDKLFHYASYGPLATFMLLVAVKVLNETNKLKADFDGIAVGLTSNSGFWFSDPKVLAGMAYFAIPIILFWMAITTAEKMASEASHASIKFGTKWSKRAGKLAAAGTAGAALVLPKYIGNRTGLDGIPGGIRNAWKNREGFGGKAYQRRKEANENKVTGFLGGGKTGFQNAKEEAFEKEVSAEVERLKKFGNETMARNALTDPSSSPEKRKAAALYMTDKGLLKNATDFNNALAAVGKDMGAASQVIGKVPKLMKSAALQASLETLDKNGHHKLMAEMISKADKDSLGESAEDYGKTMEILKRNPEHAEGLAKTYDKRLGEEGKLHIKAYHLKESGVAKGLTEEQAYGQAYAETFKKTSARNLAKQDSDLLRRSDFIDYMKKGKTDKYRKEFLNEVAKEGDDAVLMAWESVQEEDQERSRREEAAARNRERLREERRRSGR